MKKVYICHPYSCDPVGNIARITYICERLTQKKFLPIAPQLYLPQFLNDSIPEQREQAMEMCLHLLLMCDEVFVYGRTITKGMQMELDFAFDVGKPIARKRFVRYNKVKSY